ncbi:MAG: STAS domain-containing protein [Planctomycetaceae bacterium]
MASKKYMRVFPDGTVTVLHLGGMEIWDGADMALLRDSLTQLILAQKQRSIGIDMSHVKYIPSGFFGMLFDWYETGVQIRLYSPQPNVQRMLWFSRFFERVDDNCHELRPQAVIDEFPVSCAMTGHEGDGRPPNGHKPNGRTAGGHLGKAARRERRIPERNCVLRSTGQS